jgi:hypothetical protein
VLQAFRCVTVEENIMRQFPKFKEVCISEIGCRTSWAPRSRGEDVGKSNKGLAHEEGNGVVMPVVA